MNTISQEIKDKLKFLLNFDKHKINIIMKDENTIRLKALNTILDNITLKTDGNKLKFVYYINDEDGYTLYELLEFDNLDENKIYNLVDKLIEKEMNYTENKNLISQKVNSFKQIM